MKKTPAILPRFKTEAEEARFWETHDIANYWSQLKPVDETFGVSPALARAIRERSRKRLLSLRLETWQIESAKKIARRKRVPYQTLLREWIARGIRGERSA